MKRIKLITLLLYMVVFTVRWAGAQNSLNLNPKVKVLKGPSSATLIVNVTQPANYSIASCMLTLFFSQQVITPDNYSKCDNTRVQATLGTAEFVVGNSPFTLFYSPLKCNTKYYYYIRGEYVCTPNQLTTPAQPTNSGLLELSGELTVDGGSAIGGNFIGNVVNNSSMSYLLLYNELSETSSLVQGSCTRQYGGTLTGGNGVDYNFYWTQTINGVTKPVKNQPPTVGGSQSMFCTADMPMLSLDDVSRKAFQNGNPILVQFNRRVSATYCPNLSNGNAVANVLLIPTNFNPSDATLKYNFKDGFKIIVGYYPGKVISAQGYKITWEINECEDANGTNCNWFPVKSVYVNSTTAELNASKTVKYKYRARINIGNYTFYSPTLDLAELRDIETATIGTQTWMKKDLKVSQFNDGTAITEIKDWDTWNKATTPSYYNPGNTNYGYVYNKYVVNNTKNVCPVGWKVASNDDWSVLQKAAKSVDLAGTNVNWSSIKGVPPTNTTGFSAVPAGYVEAARGSLALKNQNTESVWWAGNGKTCWFMEVNYERLDSASLSGANGFYIRCIKQ